MDDRHIGSNFDDFLVEEGLLEEATRRAVNRMRSARARGCRFLRIFDDE